MRLREGSRAIPNEVLDRCAPGKAATCRPTRGSPGALLQRGADFRAALPEATIYVYDNNSADRTGEVARAAGALMEKCVCVAN